jgi:Domain of unknown function (DUF4335)
MESTNSTTRTYTAPTCSLVVTTKGAPLPHLTQLKQPDPVDAITLHLEQGESARVTLNGNPQQLNQLQQSVSQYVAELVAKFPLPTTASHPPDPAQPSLESDPADGAISNRLYPKSGEPAAPSGLMQNLPGLRLGTTQPNPAKQTDTSSANPLSAKNISKLLGRGNSDKFGMNQSNRQPPAGTASSTPESAIDRSRSGAPYLTANDESALPSHKLHLGNLATPNSGEVLTLSVIQLLDLSSVLEEYATAVVAPTTVADPTPAVVTDPIPPKSKLNPTSYPKGIGATEATTPPPPASVEPVRTPISRLPNLPNLPNLPATPKPTQFPDYTDGTERPAFTSVIPWAAAAALAVGVPLLLFGSKSNSLKELTASVKLPAFTAPDLNEAKKSVMSRIPGQSDLDAAKKSVLSHLPGQEPATSPSETGTGTTQANLPKPWEQQSVQPPATQTSPKVAGAQIPAVDSDKIGIAPLPPTIMGNAQQSAPTQAPKVSGAQPAIASAPAPDNSLSEVAPNPLSSPSIPTMIPPSIATAPQPLPKSSNPVTTLPVTPAKIVTVAKTSKPGAKINPSVGKVTPAKISIGKKSTVIPPNISVSKTNMSGLSTPVPFSPAEIAVVNRIDPAPLKPVAPKKATQPKVKVKPTAIATKPKKAATIKPPVSPFMTSKPSFEQITPAPNSNPNIIGPMPSTEGSEVQTPAIVTEPQTQSNVGRNPANPDPFDSPSLQETKRYLQGKWQADPNQPNPLQYVVQVRAKSGVVRSVNPQGEAAMDYLKKTGLLKPGQKLVSPAAAGNSDQKIRVLLQPDGNVDAFVEP